MKAAHRADMAKQQPARKQAPTKRSGVWIAVAVVVILAAVGAFYLLRTPSPAPESPTATAPQGRPAEPYTPKHIYSESADPQADIAAGLKKAAQEHKRVLLDFGGDWCGDCQVLDIYFHQPPNSELLQRNFVLVHVWIGHMDRNLELAAKYGVPINKGVPALAVLDPDGKVIYAQGTGEFRDMRHMESNSVTDFLEKWKA
jgi:thiol:disulfide interchange protein